MALRSSVLGLGSAQVLICLLVFGAAVYLWGADLPSSVIIGGALTFSSTAIVTRELAATRRLHTRQGQLAIGVLLFQDVVAVFFLILVPVLFSLFNDFGVYNGHDHTSTAAPWVATVEPEATSVAPATGGCCRHG